MRIAIFIDGSNFYYTQKKLEWKVDVKKILDYCSQWGDITDAYYYNGSDGDNDNQRGNWRRTVLVSRQSPDCKRANGNGRIRIVDVEKRFVGRQRQCACYAV